jgi:DNA-binding FrmR family transcriptional regulator
MTMELEQPVVDDALKRLHRASGQLRAVIGMLEENKDCTEVVTQLAAVSRALERTGFKLIASGLKQCIAAREAGEPSADEVRLEKLLMSL